MNEIFKSDNKAYKVKFNKDDMISVMREVLADVKRGHVDGLVIIASGKANRVHLTGCLDQRDEMLAGAEIVTQFFEEES